MNFMIGPLFRCTRPDQETRAGTYVRVCLEPEDLFDEMSILVGDSGFMGR